MDYDDLSCLSVHDMTAIECHPPLLYEFLWCHYFRTRTMVTILLLLFLCVVCGSSQSIMNCHTFWQPVTDWVYWTCMLFSVTESNKQQAPFQQPSDLDSKIILKNQPQWIVCTSLIVNHKGMWVGQQEKERVVAVQKFSLFHGSVIIVVNYFKT